MYCNLQMTTFFLVVNCHSYVNIILKNKQFYRMFILEIIIKLVYDCSWLWYDYGWRFFKLIAKMEYMQYVLDLIRKIYVYNANFVITTYFNGTYCSDKKLASAKNQHFFFILMLMPINQYPPYIYVYTGIYG